MSRAEPQLTARTAAADAVARVLVGGFDLCEDAGRPLSALQQVELIKAAMLEFEGPEPAVNGGIEIERYLFRGAANGS